MIKGDFVSALSERGYYKGQASEVIDDIFAVIKEALLRGEKVQIRGFGTFEIITKKGHMGSDPNTHEPKMYADYDKIHFRPSKYLREEIKAKGRKNKSKLSSEKC